MTICLNTKKRANVIHMRNPNLFTLLEFPSFFANSIVGEYGAVSIIAFFHYLLKERWIKMSILLKRFLKLRNDNSNKNAPQYHTV